MLKEDGGVCSVGHDSWFGDRKRKITLMRSGLLYLSDLPHKLISRKGLAGYCLAARLSLDIFQAKDNRVVLSSYY